MTENSCPGLGQAQHCGGVKPVFIFSFHSFNFSLYLGQQFDDNQLK